MARIQPFLTMSSAIPEVWAIIASKLDYCSNLFRVSLFLSLPLYTPFSVSNQSDPVNCNKQFLTGYPPRAQCRRSKGKCPSPRLYLKKAYLHTFKAAVWGSSFQSAFNQVLTETLPFGTLTCLRTPSTTKNKEHGLDNHKGLKHNQEHGQGWTVRFISYRRSLFQGWQRWLFYLVHRDTYREPRKMKKQECSKGKNRWNRRGSP